MIHPAQQAEPEVARPFPWEDPCATEEIAFAVLSSPRADPGSDGGSRVLACRLIEGRWETLEGGAQGASAFAELASFVAGRSVIVPDRDAFLHWMQARLSAASPSFRIIGLSSLASLLVPGRPVTADDVARTLDALALARATASLVAKSLARSEAALAIFAHGVESLYAELARTAPEAALDLAFTAALCEHPSRWLGSSGELHPEHAALEDGRLSRSFASFETLEDALEQAEPPYASIRSSNELGVRAALPVTLDSSDRRAVDEIFQEHLPRLLASEPGVPSHRAGQQGVAARIAESFGERELLLVHAPTGTGKTLAYLVPTLLWAFRNGVRVGVATFTRALQEQAMERDMPLARELLARIGVRDVRASVLKGRANYLCWRAVRQALPPLDAPSEDLLAWLSVALFALGDGEGDLDRFSPVPPLASLDRALWRAAIQRTLRLVRAETGCCTHEKDRRACGAEAARQRAERSHLVLTNHAFALSRPEFFRHLVFDECEHLHAVAQDAFSYAISLRSLSELLGRFHRHGAGGERPLGRIAALAVPGSALWSEALAAIDALEASRAALERLETALDTFERWRDARIAERSGSGEHALFREFVASAEAAPLCAAHAGLCAGLETLAERVQRVAEVLGEHPSRAAPRMLRSLDVLRRDLDEASAAVKAWIPRGADGEPLFGPEVFHDLERTSAGEAVLASRVLLPHEFLGRRYFPDLAGAVLLSATTWLRGGFETSAAYLGLARAAAPAEDEDRLPCALATFRAPETFDYSRVLVAVPRDAPSVRDDKGAFLDYVARFVASLAERTGGRMLVLFTNAEDLALVARQVAPGFAERGLPFFWQGMQESTKEELGELFRSRVDSVLFGLDTFWFGTDFPGRTLEYLVIVRLPYGVPDRYHHAQCAALGEPEQRRAIYLPRALAKFRQGFGRLMRKESDRGCVLVLDKRILDPRHRGFLREIPVRSSLEEAQKDLPLAAFLTAHTDRCIDAALTHMQVKSYECGPDHPHPR